MNHEQIKSLILRLYTGVPNGMERLLDHDIVFRDPLVIVKGKTSVLNMFRKINRLFPKAQIFQHEEINQTENHCRWSLGIDYRGKSKKWIGGTKEFHTELVIQFANGGRITQIIEHWSEPFNLRGDGKNPLLRAGRRILGLGLGSRLP